MAGYARIVGVALLLLSAGSVMAGPEWPVARGSAREPVPYTYDAAQWQRVPAEFLDDAPACTLYSGVTYLVEDDGTIETISHEITRLNSRKAIDKLGEYHTIAYDPAYEQVTLNEARVIKADGRLVPVQPKHLQLRDTITDYHVYDHSKELVISFPNLETGDCIEVKWTTRGKNPEHQGQFFTRYTFGDDAYPVVCDEVRVRLPKSRHLTSAVTGGTLESEVAEDGDVRIYHWRARNRPQLPLDENLPPKEELRLQLSLSTFKSWGEVSRWQQVVHRNCWEATPEIREVVQEVTKGLATPVEKARALTYWLRRHIRYVCVGEKHDYTPHRPGLVFENRFGDCKDTSQLLAVMLKEAGVPVALVTLGCLDDGQVLPDVPSPWGTHAILLVTIDGKEHWIDTTLSLGGWDQLVREDHDRLCMVEDDDGLRLIRTPALSTANYRVEQTTTVTIKPDGSSHCERTANYAGLAALTRRDDWVEVPAGERRRLVAAELQDANPRTRLVTLAIEPVTLQDYDLPVRAWMVFDVQGHFTDDPETPGGLGGSVSDNVVWARLLAPNLDYDRRVAFQLPVAFESAHRYVVRVPPGFKIENVPGNRTVESKWGSFNLKVTKPAGDQPNQVELVYQTRIEQVRVEPADFEEFRKFREDVGRAFRAWLAFAPVAVPLPEPVSDE